MPGLLVNRAKVRSNSWTITSILIKLSRQVEHNSEICWFVFEVTYIYMGLFFSSSFFSEKLSQNTVCNFIWIDVDLLERIPVHSSHTKTGKCEQSSNKSTPQCYTEVDYDLGRWPSVMINNYHLHIDMRTHSLLSRLAPRVTNKYDVNHCLKQ